MAKQDDFVRITLRLPPELHGELTQAAGAVKSLNAEIIERLEDSFAAAGVLREIGGFTYTVRVESPDQALPLTTIRKHLADLMLSLDVPVHSINITVVTPEQDASRAALANELMAMIAEDDEADRSHD